MDNDNEDFRVGGSDMWKAFGDKIRRSIREDPTNLIWELERQNDMGIFGTMTPEEFLRRYKFTEEEIPEILAKSKE